MTRRNISIRITAAAIGLLIALVIGEYVVRAWSAYVKSVESMDPGLIQYHPSMGWKLARNWHGTHRHFDYTVSYNTDFRGLRHNYSDPDTRTERVVVVGDSFTFGLGVNDNETFTSQLNVLQADMAFINGGVPGFAPEQYLFWLPLAQELTRADHIVLVLYLGNDLIDIGLPFPVQAQNAKPYAEVDANGALLFRHQPVPRTSKPRALMYQTLGSHVVGELQTSWFRSLKLFQLVAASAPAPEMTVLSARLAPKLQLFNLLFSQILDSVDKDITVIVLPGSSFIYSPKSLSALYQQVAGDRLVEILNSQAVPHLDLRELMFHKDERLYHRYDGHLTPAGHRRVAEEIRSFLATKLL